MANNRAPTRRGSRRVRRIWFSLIATGLGVLLVTGLAYWLQQYRETDLADASAGVTTEFAHVIPSNAPAIRFQDVAGEVGVVMRHGPGPRGRALPEDTGSGVAWGDYDGDGDPDLYFVNIPGPIGSTPGPDARNRLFRNDGGEFTDVTDTAGVGDPAGFGMGATFADYDNDGDADLYVTNFGPNRLFRNRGDGTFDEVAAAAGVADAAWSTGAAWGDYDRDGYVDLYVCNYVRYDEAAMESAAIIDPHWEGVPFTLNPNSFDPVPNRLYRNRGDGTFEDVAAAARVRNAVGRSLAASFCDLDGDGWLDLYVNNDVSANALYRNLGGMLEPGTAPIFADLSAMTGTADPRGSMGLSVGDLAGPDGGPDGRPDLFITHWVAQENALYQAVMTAGGVLEYRDKTRQVRLGEISLDAVGWGCALVDLDLDGRLDIPMVNGNTLEEPTDPTQLIAQPMFVFWNAGDRFYDVAPAAGPACTTPHTARGLAAADYDGDGDVDLAVAINRGAPLLLRNDTEAVGHALTVRLQGSDAARFGAQVEIESRCGTQRQWYGSDVTYLGMHGPDLIFGLGSCAEADEIRVVWADGTESRRRAAPAGRVEIAHSPGDQ